MRVMVIVKATKESETGALPSEQMLREMGAFNEALVKAGVMQAGDGLHPSSRGFRVHFSGKNRTVINGPFAETKELIAGFWIWKVKSLEEAIEWVKRCPNPMNEDSDIEIRGLYDMEDFAESDPTGELRANEQKLRSKMETETLGKPRFEKHPAFIVAGLNGQFKAEERIKIPQLWQKFGPFIGDVPTQVGKAAYGICYGQEADGALNYMAAVEVKNTTQLPSGFTQVRIPEAEYAVFTHNKHVSRISETFDAIYCNWLPTSGLKEASTPAFERYAEDFDPKTGLGGIEVWIPVKK